MLQGSRHFAVPIDHLRARCEPAHFSFASTATLTSPARMMGQDRAADALDFGLRIPEQRYNIFVAGPPGSGRSVAAEAAVRRVVASQPAPSDWCYVYNFTTPYEPNALALPAGQARPFAQAIDTLVESARAALRAAFDDERYRQRRNAALHDIEQETDKLKADFEEMARQHGFVVQMQQDGEPSFLPMKPGTAEQGAPEAYNREEFEALPPEERERLDAEFVVVQDAYINAGTRARNLRLQAREIVRRLNADVTREVLAPLFDELQVGYEALPDVVAYLTQMQEDMIVNSARLRAESDEESDPAGESADAAAQAASAGTPPSPLLRYRVNVLVDHGDQQSAPCVVEPNPTYYNLLGRLEYGSHMGNLFTDFTLIKPGAIHRANGGFLIIHARELLNAPRAWEGLKRALRTASATIENLSDPQQSVALAASLKPEPIPLRVKVILVGELGLWDTLNEGDPDFRELFKVRADFGPEMPRNPETEHYYAEFAGDAARALNLPPLTAAAVARIVEEGSRMAEDQAKLTTSLTSLRDLVIEAGYWARDAEVIDASHVSMALQTRRKRVSMLAERFDEQVRQGTIILATSGAAIGQINALGMASVLGEDFGRPMRVTARTAPGLGGVVDIEIESHMSGPVHTKGVLTLAGYLAGQYGQEQPLSLAATIAFEQMYGIVEGDSASLAEICVLLSALASVPIRQDLAVTGSVNQWGDVQAVGGVTLKIESFFDLCQLSGLTGGQGVVIPAANVRNLMLRPDVIEAAREGAFHIYAVERVDEAITLLTGQTAGVRQPDGRYPDGTVNARVADTVRAYAERVRYYRRGEG